MYWYHYNQFYPARIPDFGSNVGNISMWYWARSLFQRLTALIDIKGAPAFPDNPYTWDIDALKYQLLMMGYAAVIESKTYGVVPQPATLTGFGLQFQPTAVIISTPYFQIDRPLPLEVDAALIKLTPDYTGVWDVITKYAAELREVDVSIRSAIRGVRLGYAMVADSDKSARTLKNVREKIVNGEDVIIDEKLTKRNIDGNMELPWYMFERQVKQSYIVNDLIEARRDTLVDFYREIGVRMLDNKKERMLTDEVIAGNAESFIRSEVWAEALRESVKKVNKMFDLNLEIKINTPDFINKEVSDVS